MRHAANAPIYRYIRVVGHPMLLTMGTENRNIPPSEMTETQLVKWALGHVIARHRNASRIDSQREFARVVGISNSHLRGIEAGEISPTFVTIYKIATTLEEEPTELIAEACELIHRAPEISIDYLDSPSHEDA